jgi:hypothetical protein
MIQVCPDRDAVCPRGYPCPYARPRYECDIKASREALQRERENEK